VAIGEKERKMILQKFYDGRFTFSYRAHRAVKYTKAYARISLLIYDVPGKKREDIVLWSARVEQVDRSSRGKVERDGLDHSCPG